MKKRKKKLASIVKSCIRKLVKLLVKINQEFYYLFRNSEFNDSKLQRLIRKFLRQSQRLLNFFKTFKKCWKRFNNYLIGLIASLIIILTPVRVEAREPFVPYVQPIIQSQTLVGTVTVETESMPTDGLQSSKIKTMEDLENWEKVRLESREQTRLEKERSARIQTLDERTRLFSDCINPLENQNGESIQTQYYREFLEVRDKMPSPKLDIRNGEFQTIEKLNKQDYQKFLDYIRTRNMFEPVKLKSKQNQLSQYQIIITDNDTIFN